jgi:hypothetical protein
MFKKTKIKKRIFELLKKIRHSHHHGIILTYSDMSNILAKGAYPIGSKKKDFEEVCDIFSPKAEKILKNFQEDGAILIDKRGIMHLPPAYLNVNILSVDEKQIDPEFGSRHIAALACSSSTKACVFVVSEETRKVREFVKGQVRKIFPEKEGYDIPQEKVAAELIRETLKDRMIKIRQGIGF